MRYNYVIITVKSINELQGKVLKISCQKLHQDLDDQIPASLFDM